MLEPKYKLQEFTRTNWGEGGGGVRCSPPCKLLFNRMVILLLFIFIIFFVMLYLSEIEFYNLF
jgi:hypothetical protein